MKTETIHQAAQAKMQTTSALVDRLVVLHKELEPLKEKIKEMETIKAMLRDQLEGAPEQEAIVLKGALGEVEFSACRVDKQVAVGEKKTLVKMLGRETFDAVAQFPIRVLREYLNERQLEQVLTSYWGSRSMRAVRAYEHTVH